MTAPQIARRFARMLAAVVLFGLAGSAQAFHRETPAVTAITTSGDTDLPRVPSQGRRLMALVAGQEVVTLVPFSTAGLATPIAPGGDPAVSFSGRIVALETDADPLASGLPGWQIVLARNGKLSAGVPDPSGTSANPSLDKRGETLVFESAGDLTNLGTPEVVNRVYVRFKDGVLALASSGSGTSGRAMLAAKGGVVAFESTSDPTTGVDTGIEQIWVGRVTTLPAGRITGGASPSTNPIVSDDGRLVAFVSRAALASDQADTGIPQVFVYDTRTQTFAQVTNEASGCERPGIAKIQQDWRITFVCGGQAYYHMLRQNRRYHVPTPGGSTQAIVPEMGAHFVTVSTTADLDAGSGATPGHQVYLLNLFAAPVPEVVGVAAWFPFQGIPGL